MGRPRKLEIHTDGSATIRIKFGARTCKLALQHAKKHDLDVSKSLEMLTSYLEGQLMNSVINWLPSDWQMLHKELRNNEAGLPPRLLGIDISKLHRSDKTKSGFVGVYANGRGFRAMNRNNQYIGQYDSAEEAAWARYVNHKQSGLPYGPLEERVDDYKADGRFFTNEETAMIEIVESSQYGGDPLYYVQWLPDNLKDHPRIQKVLREAGIQPGSKSKKPNNTSPVLATEAEIEARIARQRARDEAEERREQQEAAARAANQALAIIDTDDDGDDA